ncbi:MAG: CDP-2,3-bis-(O-geranylgeranyl)-sn-glycerol synthase [Candidatus Marsarchaeota archaeon]|jgi:CDP-2,3-bis-(O-geranylgeranyl)-sn-glycerol synthase|nr:CDP-2,3-bis-(O-geranylgeranyl)-sn-glycerol synthase [Candidatus Marsarchaeota archaeon]
MNYYNDIIYPILYILPAFIANATPVIFGGNTPLDFKKKLFKKRIFGDHKTVRGTFSGIFAGILVGIIESFYLPQMLMISVVLSLGAMFGDLLGSFIKRRINVTPGSSIPVLDQFGFVIFALIFAAPFGYIPNIIGIILIFVLTAILHPLTNIIAYKIKLKKVPW